MVFAFLVDGQSQIFERKAVGASIFFGVLAVKMPCVQILIKREVGSFAALFLQAVDALGVRTMATYLRRFCFLLVLLG